MMKRRTTIVVGAGASCEYGLPSGLELRAQISKLLDIRFEYGYKLISGDHTICDAMKLAANSEDPPSGDINPYLTASWRIRDAMPQAISIDNYIDVHKDNLRLAQSGKFAIVQGILSTERRSSLYFNPSDGQKSPDFSKLEKTWLAAFMQLLTESCPRSELDERLRALTIVVFNYDRCIEHYLYHALQVYYGISGENAAEHLTNLTVLHPYGLVGALPWMNRKHRVAFGAEISGHGIFEISKEIKTFTEGVSDERSEISEIRLRMAESDVVLFLGFAYHRKNIELLRAEAPHKEPARVSYLGTAKGISNSDCSIVIEQLTSIASASSGRVTLRNDLTCEPLFREYWRTLSLS